MEDHNKRKKSKARFRPAKRRAHLTPGQALKTLRKLQGMTQNDLAKASGIGQPVISAMEHDRVSMGVERAKKLARALHVYPPVLIALALLHEDGWGVA